MDSVREPPPTGEWAETQMGRFNTACATVGPQRSARGCARALLLAIAIWLVPWSGGVAWARSDYAAQLDRPNQMLAALDFEAETLDGGTLRLSELRGNVVFLNFWATWCVPCREEMPAMERVRKATQDAPFRMVAMNLQEPAETVRKFVEELGLTFQIALDRTGAISRTYLVQNLPLTYIIDKQGRIVARAIGSRPWDKQAYLAYLRGLIEE